MDYNQLLQKAVERIASYPTNKIFVVKDIFTGIEWDELKPGEKRYFGQYFSNAYKDGKIIDIIYLGKMKNNSAKYQKK